MNQNAMPTFLGYFYYFGGMQQHSSLVLEFLQKCVIVAMKV
jgi:hypothetical protein